jgi:hypothetical protein
MCCPAVVRISEERGRRQSSVAYLSFNGVAGNILALRVNT